MSYRISKEFDAQRSLMAQQYSLVQVHAPASIPHAARVGESRPRTLASPLPLGPPLWLAVTLADSCPTPAVTLRGGAGPAVLLLPPGGNMPKRLASRCGLNSGGASPSTRGDHDRTRPPPVLHRLAAIPTVGTGGGLLSLSSTLVSSYCRRYCCTSSLSPLI